MVLPLVKNKIFFDFFSGFTKGGPSTLRQAQGSGAFAVLEIFLQTFPQLLDGGTHVGLNLATSRARLLEALDRIAPILGPAPDNPQPKGPQS